MNSIGIDSGISQSGFMEGFTATIFIPVTKLRTSIIFPAMYAGSRQTSAVSFFFNWRACCVNSALAVICPRVIVIGLGDPVDPLVFCKKSSVPLNHCAIKENVDFSNGDSGVAVLLIISSNETSRPLHRNESNG